jgi:hypothetical protein
MTNGLMKYFLFTYFNLSSESVQVPFAENSGRSLSSFLSFSSLHLSLLRVLSELEESGSKEFRFIIILISSLLLETIQVHIISLK